GSILEEAINRRVLETGVEIRPPSLSRIFDKKIAGYTIKHAIEPRIRYRYVNGVENFPEIIRFDVNDIVSDTNELEYALVNRIYAKGSKSTECRNPEVVQEFAPAAPKGKVPGTPGVESAIARD